MTRRVGPAQRERAARDIMRFASGTRQAYSNVGYLLLGALVEKLYGKPYGAALREEIPRPLGLRTLRWCTDPRQDTTVATGYSYEGPGIPTNFILELARAVSAQAPQTPPSDAAAPGKRP